MDYSRIQREHTRSYECNYHCSLLCTGSAHLTLRKEPHKLYQKEIQNKLVTQLFESAPGGPRLWAQWAWQFFFRYSHYLVVDPVFVAVYTILMYYSCLQVPSEQIVGNFRDVLGHQHTFSWWHGKGGLLDYSNQEALSWWHGQMDKVYVPSYRAHSSLWRLHTSELLYM